MYRRQLLQHCRHVEIDCWDGARGPIVTHGHTFCTIETFSAVSVAVAECSFVTSSLPVILSMEMHCSRKIQYRLASMLVRDIGDKLMPYDEIAAVWMGTLATPKQLERRVLIKGKVKPLKRKKLKEKIMDSDDDRESMSSRVSAGRTSAGTSAVRAVGLNALRKGSRKLGAKLVSLFSSKGESEEQAELKRSESAATERFLISATGVEFQNRATVRVMHKMGTARGKLDKKMKSAKDLKNGTDPFYASFLAIRSEPVTVFLGRADPKWALPITSVNEDRFLKELGLSTMERNLIEGLLGGRSPSDPSGLELTEEQQTMRALVRLAANPPLRVGKMQRRTAKALLRPCKSCLRTDALSIAVASICRSQCTVRSPARRPARPQIQWQEYEPHSVLARRRSERVPQLQRLRRGGPVALCLVPRWGGIHAQAGRNDCPGVRGRLVEAQRPSIGQGQRPPIR